jgi:hypothetical protein
LRELGPAASAAAPMLADRLERAQSPALRRMIYGALVAMGQPAAGALQQRMRLAEATEVDRFLSVVRCRKDISLELMPVLLTIVSRTELDQRDWDGGSKMAGSMIREIDPETKIAEQLLKTWKASDDLVLNHEAELLEQRQWLYARQGFQGGIF